MGGLCPALPTHAPLSISDQQQSAPCFSPPALLQMKLGSGCSGDVDQGLDEGRVQVSGKLPSDDDSRNMYFFLPLHTVDISACSSSVYKLWCVWEGGCGEDWYLGQSNDMGLHLSHGNWGNLESKPDLEWQHFFYLFELQSSHHLPS